MKVLTKKMKWKPMIQCGSSTMRCVIISQQEETSWPNPSYRSPRSESSQIIFSPSRSQFPWAWYDHFTDLNIQFRSSLHNIILNTFCVILVLWRLLESGLSFSFLRQSCSKKFLWRLKVHIVWVELLLSSLSLQLWCIFYYVETRTFWNSKWMRKTPFRNCLSKNMCKRRRDSVLERKTK